MIVSEILNEAKASRGWEGKLTKIDKLLAWMYSKNIMSAADQKRKDIVFRQYYRYYNDGDMPAALKVKGISKFDKKYNPDMVETELEEYLETFIKKMLSKYMSLANRKAFRLDSLIADLNLIHDVAGRNDPHGLLTWWLKKIKIADEDGVLKDLVNKLQKASDAFTAEANKVDTATSGHKNLIMTARREAIEKDGKWSKKLEATYDATVDAIKQVDDFVVAIIKSSTELRKLVPTLAKK